VLRLTTIGAIHIPYCVCHHDMVRVITHVGP